MSPDLEKRLRDAGLARDDLASLERRLILKRGLGLGSALLLAGCDVTDQGPVNHALLSVSRFNDWVQSVIFRPDHLAPTYPISRAVQDFRYNAIFSRDESPIIDPTAYRLDVSGRVADTRPWTLADLRAMPQTSYTARHVCVEGWSMIGNWGGVPLRAFLDKVGADRRAKYVGFRCSDKVNYSGSIDMASARHPQTILCLDRDGQPLTGPFGAPMRLKMTTKLGYKQPKWITHIFVTNTNPGGFWEDWGYPWFGGI